ncbi:hypothetical protein MEX01_28960 [Methylorubrum extorquens]|uniref:hypothetical protein n=1 Tax=Methylorubrum extorquens TaxID=408 RepID=UPI0011732611|nr:hypothetical protein [Methylorubrum extorquens]GEL42305.1 hypothetical protein MEX01_28960 [Methylorubrum extorquens]
MSRITSTVLRRGAARFDMVGQRLPDSLHDTGQFISNGTVKRLHRYALRALTDAGFDVSEWACEVYTMDGDDAPSERTYCVEFTNAKGGMLGVQGIHTYKGHPCLDHGLCIDFGRSTPIAAGLADGGGR